MHQMRKPAGSGPSPSTLPRNLTPYYGGAWHAAGTGPALECHNPATAERLAIVRAATAEDVERAVAQARSAQPAWGRLSPAERAGAVRKLREGVQHHAEELARLDALDSGNPLRGMRIDLGIATALLGYFAGLATELKGQTIPLGSGKLDFAVREPLGVVARLVPFNHPLMFACIKSAPPLVAGNTVILKPSEHTPLSALRLAELAEDIFPPGVFNVLPGLGDVGEALARHPGVDGICLVGSVPTGRKVMEAASGTLKRLMLELGGKNALIVYPDVDLDKAADGAVKGMNFGWTAGQSCGATSRVLVHAAVHDALVERIVARVERIRLGIPEDADTEMGCLTTRAQYDKTLRYIELALGEGARLMTGGPPDHPPHDKGLYIRPTVFTGVQPTMRIAREEVFGPILAVMRWEDEEQLIEWANDVEYGLTASVWTRDIDRALRTVSRLQAGYVWVNNSSDHFLGAPFGGYKQSGFGREECLEELLAFTQLKNINVTFEA